MDFAENYGLILSNVFRDDLDSKEEADLINKAKPNNCTLSLFDVKCCTFRTNFIERLERLYDHFSNNKEQLREIKNTAKNIAWKDGHKWSGPYSELVALDYWIRFENLLDITFQNKGKTGVDIFEDSFAKSIGMEEVDIDLSFTLFSSKVYMDVKSLIPLQYEITDNIVETMGEGRKYQGILIGLENLQSSNYLDEEKFLAKNTDLIIGKLKGAIKLHESSYVHKMPNNIDYKFKIAYPDNEGKTFQACRSIMNPYAKAENERYRFLKYYKKLLFSKPSLLIFVRNPLFNREQTNFLDFSATYYRAVTRRVFMELTKNVTKAKSIFKKITRKDVTVADIAKLITGIVFIEDNSLKKKDENLYKTFIFLNPNAANGRLVRDDFQVLNWTSSSIQPLIEEFKYDNY